MMIFKACLSCGSCNSCRSGLGNLCDTNRLTGTKQYDGTFRLKDENNNDIYEKAYGDENEDGIIEIVAIDEKGQISNGDQLLAIFARELMLKNKLTHNTVVATSMSNMGLEKFLTSQGLKLLRTDVGDRYVVEQMQKNGINLGGEQSGHVIFSDFSTTGDGLIASLQFLAAMQGNRSSASELLNLYEPYPQLLENVKIDQSN